MKLKITKGDILFLFIGLCIAFPIDTVFNWKEDKQDFLEDYNSTVEKVEPSIKK